MIDGEVPENGIIYFDKNGEVAFSLDFEDEVYVKSFEGDIEKETNQENADQISYLKVATTTNGLDQLFLEGPITKAQIEKVITVPTNKVPSDAKGSWDVSEKGNGKIMAWYYEVEKEDGAIMYDVYIVQEGGVKANPDSTKLFNYLVNVKQIDLTYLNAEYVTYMTGMFQRCGILERIIGLENFDTSNVTIMYGMFQNCTNLSTIYVTKEKWVRNTTFDIENMFNNTNAVVKDINTNEIITW